MIKHQALQFYSESAILAQSHWSPQSSVSSAASAKRSQEFDMGRLCAEKALNLLGGPGSQIEKSPHGFPLFPEGFKGSISHTDHHAAALVAKDVLSVGLDIEFIMPAEKFEKIKKKILTASDQDYFLKSQFSHIEGTILFSAKECLYKLLYPQTIQFFGFQDAEIGQFSIHEKRLSLKIKNEMGDFQKDQSFDIFYFMQEELIVTYSILS